MTSPPSSPRGQADIRSRTLPALQWGDEHMRANLEHLFRFAEAHCLESIDWYLREKKSKSRWSRLVRSGAILLAALGAIVPLVHAATSRGPAIEWGYVFLALAAAAVGWDRFFGLSSAWMRYLAATFALQRVLQEFQDDWTRLHAQVGDGKPTPDQLGRALSRLKRFRSTVLAVIEDETREWIAEFETNLARLEANLDSSRRPTANDQGRRPAGTDDDLRSTGTEAAT